MPVDIMTRVASADPISESPPVPSLEGLRQRIEEVDHKRSVRTKRLRRFVVIVVPVSVLLAVVLVMTPGGRQDVLAAVYDATSPTSTTLQIVSRTTEQVDGVLTTTTDRSEWAQAAQGRLRTSTTVTNHATGNVLKTAFATDGSVVRSWSDQRPDVIREIPVEPDVTLATPDAGVRLLRWLYQSGRLRVVGRTTVAGVDQFELRGQVGFHTELDAYVNADTFVPVQITTTDKPTDGSVVVTETRYSTYQQVEGDVTLSFPDHPALPIEKIRPYYETHP